MFSLPITLAILLFLFAVLFGLSMDYHVFVVSRIRRQRRVACLGRATWWAPRFMRNRTPEPVVAEEVAVPELVSAARH